MKRKCQHRRKLQSILTHHFCHFLNFRTGHNHSYNGCINFSFLLTFRSHRLSLLHRPSMISWLFICAKIIFSRGTCKNKNQYKDLFGIMENGEWMISYVVRCCLFCILFLVFVVFFFFVTDLFSKIIKLNADSVREERAQFYVFHYVSKLVRWRMIIMKCILYSKDIIFQLRAFNQSSK